MLNAALERVDFSKVVKVYTRPTGVDWKKYEDGKEYNGTLTIKNEDGFVLATLNVTMTKEIPNQLYHKASPLKTNKVNYGIYNCYYDCLIIGLQCQASKGCKWYLIEN